MIKSVVQTLYLWDVTWLFLAIFLICSIETKRLQNDPDFRAFKIVSEVFRSRITAKIFELAGAYGTVGLSLGYPGTVTGFVAQLSPPSKVIVIFVMLLGTSHTDNTEIVLEILSQLCSGRS